MPRTEPHQQPRTVAEEELADYFRKVLDMHRSSNVLDLRSKGYAYGGVFDYLLQHGRWYVPRRLPKHIPRLAPKQCFWNSVILGVIHGTTYVEGYAMSTIGLPVHHAWGSDAQGRLYEVTWDMVGTAYCGVEFSLERADNATWVGDASVLDDWKRRWPIFQQPWDGEPEVSPFEPSPCLQLMREEKYYQAFAWALAHHS